jgi:uncharacterized CHY-type Zn-finger protein
MIDQYGQSSETAPTATKQAVICGCCLKDITRQAKYSTLGDHLLFCKSCYFDTKHKPYGLRQAEAR